MKFITQAIILRGWQYGCFPLSFMIKIRAFSIQTGGSSILCLFVTARGSEMSFQVGTRSCWLSLARKACFCQHASWFLPKHSCQSQHPVWSLDKDPHHVWPHTIFQSVPHKGLWWAELSWLVCLWMQESQFYLFFPCLLPGTKTKLGLWAKAASNTQLFLLVLQSRVGMVFRLHVKQE